MRFPFTVFQTAAAMFWRPVVFGLLCAYLFTVHYTRFGEVGIERNIFTGELTLDTPGWNATYPWVRVAKMTIQPQRVCMTTTAVGALSCKLVQFDPRKFKEFVQTEGFQYYWFANRFSFNFGYGEEYRGARDILRGYAYSSSRAQFPFIKILQE